MHRITRNKFWWIVVSALAFYALIAATIPGDVLVATLNSLFVGLCGGFLFAFWRLIFGMAFTRDDLEDWRLLFMSIMTGGLAFLIFFAINVASLSYGREPWEAALHFQTFAKYLAILATIGTILSPGFHHGYFRGEDKRTVWASIALGLLIAAVTSVMQLTSAME